MERYAIYGLGLSSRQLKKRRLDGMSNLFLNPNTDFY